MRVAVVQLAPGIANADDRLVLKDVGGKSLGPQPGAPRVVFIRLAAPPLLAPKFFDGVCGHEVLLERGGGGRNKRRGLSGFNLGPRLKAMRSAQLPSAEPC